MTAAQQIYASFGGMQTAAYGWVRNTSWSFTKKGPGRRHQQGQQVIN